MTKISRRQRQVTHQGGGSDQGIRQASTVLAPNLTPTPGDGKIETNGSEQCEQLTDFVFLSLLAHLSGGELRSADDREITLLLTSLESLQIPSGRFVTSQVVNQNVTIEKDFVH